jgi:hypothetical protein
MTGRWSPPARRCPPRTGASAGIGSSVAGSGARTGQERTARSAELEPTRKPPRLRRPTLDRVWLGWRMSDVHCPARIVVARHGEAEYETPETNAAGGSLTPLGRAQGARRHPWRAQWHPLAGTRAAAPAGAFTRRHPGSPRSRHGAAPLRSRMCSGAAVSAHAVARRCASLGGSPPSWGSRSRARGRTSEARFRPARPNHPPWGSPPRAGTGLGHLLAGTETHDHYTARARFGS